MSSMSALILIFGLILLLVCAGMRVGYVLVLVGLIGLTWLLDPSQPAIIGNLVWKSAVSYSLTAVPLFVFMAEIMVRSGVSGRAYKSALQWLGGVRGGGAYAAVAGSTIFAAMSGSSVANAAAMGTIAGKQLVESGYSKKLAFGTIAAGGTLGILIPPSTAMIIYGTLTGESIGHLFMAGVIPGILGAALFAVVVFVWSLVRAQDAPALPPVPLNEKLKGLLGLTPTFVLLAIVLGGIYAGVFSPSEAAGIGAFFAVVIALTQRAMSREILRKSTEATVALTAMIMFIVAGATVVTYVVGMLGIPGALSEAVAKSGLPVWAVLVAIAVLFFVLGCFIESVSLIVLVVPVLYPVLTALHVDGIWLGVYVILLVEIGLITPPVGLNLFVLQKVEAGQTLEDITVGVMPYLLAMLALLAALLIVPELATWLPQKMTAK